MRKRRLQCGCRVRTASAAAGGRTPRRLTSLSNFNSETEVVSGCRFLEQYGGSRTRFRPGSNLRGGEPRPAPSATVRLQAAHAEGWGGVCMRFWGGG